MPIALCTTSHSPLMGRNQPDDEVLAAVDAAVGRARNFVREFDPQLVIVFGPDHYNGVFYDMMPAFCVAAEAESVGDYGVTAGPLRVDRDVAYAIAEEALHREIDLAVSERLRVDHGIVQPLDLLLGGLDTPVVPVFINCVALPLGPVRRARLLGQAVGAVAGRLDRRVLLLGSGGLSHDPPVPRLEGAPPEIREKLIAGRNPTTEQRRVREEQVTAAGRAFGAGDSNLMPLNPDWDERFMRILASGDLESIDAWTNEWFVEQAGNSSHEVRTWLAAYAALRERGPYVVEDSFYRPIPEWIAGFGVTSARPAEG